jgi:GDP-L-fucose synthase
MPTNLYGPNDNYDLGNSHVIPALIKKFIIASERGESSVEVWGSGKPMREFMHVDDLGDASLFLMKNYSDLEFINVGVGIDMSIAELAKLIKEITGYKGEITFNSLKPDGTPRKLMDVSKLTSLGWRPSILLENGLRSVIKALLVTKEYRVK